MSATIYENPNVLPQAFRNVRLAVRDNKYNILQQKMIDAGWEPNESGNVITFTHNKYGKRKFPCRTIVTSEGEKLMFPISAQDEDPKGLACDVRAVASGCQSVLVSNEWHSYWDTRKGKRRERYYAYLDRRQKKKKEIEEEEAKAKIIPNIF